MNAKQATQNLAAFALSHVKTAPIDEQIEIFESLSVILPNKQDRLEAGEIAHRLAETAKLESNLANRIADKKGPSK